MSTPGLYTFQVQDAWYLSFGDLSKGFGEFHLDLNNNSYVRAQLIVFNYVVTLWFQVRFYTEDASRLRYTPC